MNEVMIIGGMIGISNEDNVAVFDEAAEVTRIKPFPMMGDSLAIKHKVKHNGNGDVVGVHRADGVDVVTITAVYLDGTVRTGIADQWEVALADGRGTKQAKWMTVNPSHGEQH